MRRSVSNRHRGLDRPRPTGRTALALALAMLAVAASGGAPAVPRGPDADARGHTAPTEATLRVLAAAAAALPLADPQDAADATRGLVARPESLVVRDAEGRVVWDRPAYDFLEGPAPGSVHPSLWRQARLNNEHGLFEVVPGIHQLRGFDLANMTLIEGDTGWIVVDPLGSTETAAAALAFAREHLGARPVTALIVTHSHIDHFGGILGVVSPDEVEAKGIPIVAPAGFLEAATSENVLAGLGMARRASFMYGFRLGRDARGHLDSGLGKEPTRGRSGILAPNRSVDATTDELVLDGVRFAFLYTPETEAPAELVFYLPDHRALCSAEIVTHTMHNVYTLRGARVRDAARWSEAIEEMRTRFGDESDVLFASHHWPVWGGSEVRQFLEGQSDLYQFLHDQTLRLANQGHTPSEIAESLELPSSLARRFGNRGYYGTLRHNTRAVYQRYFGWYDGNPARLDPLPPVELGLRYVRALGGVEAVLEEARRAFEAADYRWVATLLDHLVFADERNTEARALLARTYDQLGYQAESAAWRDAYLSAAFELRHGPPGDDAPSPLENARDLLAEIPIERFLAALAARIDAEKAEDESVTINITFRDLGESHVLWLRNAVLRHRRSAPDPEAEATITLTHRFFLRLIAQEASVREMLFSDELEVEGSRLALVGFFSLFDRPAPGFPIVTP